MLLHEETYRPAEKLRKARLSRHYYDLSCLINEGVAEAAVAEAAVADANLFERVAEHRANYFRVNWVDYSTLRRGSLRLLPSEDQIPYWRGDYRAMSTEMFFQAPPDFDEVLSVVGRFETEFNQNVEQPTSGG